MPKISLIVPVYNDERHLGKCLQSVFGSDYKDFEVIVVNDGSSDSSLEIAKSFPCRVVNLENNKGVANARNQGANAAKGDLLIFLDSDIMIEKDTISNFANAHRNPDIKICYCQLYPKSLTGGFAPDLIALIWHYYNKLMGRYSSFIPTEAFSIYKKVFDEIGQFNTSFASSGGEEFEIGTVVERHGYKIYSDQSFYVHHHFQKFWPRCKTLFRRSYVYGNIVFQRNFKLDKGHGTMKEGVNAVLSVIGAASLMMAPFFYGFLILFFAIIAAQVILDLGLNIFIISQRGVVFFLRSIPLQYIWYLMMGLGILKAFFKYTCQIGVGIFTGRKRAVTTRNI